MLQEFGPEGMFAKEATGIERNLKYYQSEAAKWSRPQLRKYLLATKQVQEKLILILQDKPYALVHMGGRTFAAAEAGAPKLIAQYQRSIEHMSILLESIEAVTP